MRALSSGYASHPAMATVWWPVATVDEVDRPLARTVCGQRVVLFPGGDGVAALPDRCPHRNAPLSAGTASAGRLRCPYHGWSFDGDGSCVEIPSSGPGATPAAAAHLTPYRVVERYGLVWLCLGEPESDLPELAWESDPSFRRLHLPVERWASAATRAVDNFMDIAHFPYVHAGTIGGAADPVVAPIELEPLPGGFHGYRYEVTVGNEGAGSVASGQDGSEVEREMTTGFRLPLMVRSTITYRTGLEHIILLALTPIDAVSCYFVAVLWRNDGSDTAAEEALAFDRAIAAEDRAMLEAIPGPLPLGNEGVVSTRADRPSLAWKRRFVAWLSERDGG